MILLVMFSRNYLGVHTPQDVVGGLLLCLLVMYFNARVLEWAEQKQGRDLLVYLGGIVFFGAALIYMTGKTYPMDYTADGRLLVDPVNMIAQGYTGVGCAIGFLTGWLLERRFVCFEIPSEWKTRFIRFALGVLSIAAVVLLFCEPMKRLLREYGDIGYCFSNFMYFSVLYIYIMAGFPYLLKLLEKKKK